MPPRKTTAAANKKAAEPKVKAETKTKAAKAAAPATKQPTKPTTPALTNGVHTTALRGKRKAEDVATAPKTSGTKRQSTTPAPEPAAKRPKTITSPKAAAKKPVTKPAAAKKPAKAKAVINHAPTDRLNVYVFGEGSNGELGLGSAKGSLEVKRPRLNPLLAADTVGVVQIAVGGMHTIVLTHDNKILTWGINDQSALGRDTAWDGGLKDMDAEDSDSDAEEIAVNPHESSPAEVDLVEVPEDTLWTQVIASDSASFALTSDGLVYGWGTFRGNDGVIGFSATTLIQTHPTQLKDLKKITHLACGSNHVLALTSTGGVYAWGSGQQNQLGRRIIERTKLNGLTPSQFGLKGKPITLIGCGSYHSFAVTTTGAVYAWGLNSYGETGIRKAIDHSGDESDVHHPALIPELSSGAHGRVTHIDGGAHHSICVTNSSACLVWGRMDGCQSGIPPAQLPTDSLIYDSASKPRILATPTQIPGLKASHCAAGSDHCLAVGVDGKVYSWGFNATYQCGQGSDDDIEACTVIANTAVKDKAIVWAGAGGQFSVVAGLAAAGEGHRTVVNGLH